MSVYTGIIKLIFVSFWPGHWLHILISVSCYIFPHFCYFPQTRKWCTVVASVVNWIGMVVILSNLSQGLLYSYTKSIILWSFSAQGWQRLPCILKICEQLAHECAIFEGPTQTSYLSWISWHSFIETLSLSLSFLPPPPPGGGLVSSFLGSLCLSCDM